MARIARLGPATFWLSIHIRDPSLAHDLGQLDATFVLQAVLAEEGLRGLMAGWGPTMVRQHAHVRHRLMIWHEHHHCRTVPTATLVLELILLT